MTPTEQLQFRFDFMSIKHVKDLISKNKCVHNRLHLIKTDQKREISREANLKRREELGSELKSLLKGRSYEYWNDISIELNHIDRQMKKFEQRREQLKF